MLYLCIVFVRSVLYIVFLIILFLKYSFFVKFVLNVVYVRLFIGLVLFVDVLMIGL